MAILSTARKRAALDDLSAPRLPELVIEPQPLRSLEAIRADILALEKETDGLPVEIVGGGAR